MKTANIKFSFSIVCFLLLVFTVFLNLFNCEIAQSSNLVKNGEFQLDSSCWRAKYWYKSKIDYLTTEDINIRTDKTGNSYQLLVPVNHPTQSVRIMSDPFKIQDNSDFAYSMDIKIEGKPRAVAITILNDNIWFNKSFSITNEWQNIKFSGRLPSSAVNMCRIEIRTSGEKGTIYLKSVKLDQPQVPQPAGKLVEVSLQSSNTLSMYELGSEVIFTVRSSVSANENVPLNWILSDLYGNIVKSGQLKLNSGFGISRLSLGKLGLGWYSLQYSIDKRGYNISHDKVAFTVLPRLADRPIISPEKSFFGVHTEITNDGLLAAKLMGFRWIRLNAPLITKWNAVEETQGVFTFNDPAISAIRREGLAIVGTLDRTAAWASTGQDDPKTKSSNFYGAYSYLPVSWDLWDNYVSTVVAHYKNDIRYWQVWNEPDIQFLVPPKGMTNAKTYSMIVSRTAPLVRKANPDSILMGGVAYLKQHYPGPGRQDNFPEEMLKLGIIKLLNIFTYHHYVHKNENLDQNLSEFAFAKSLFKGTPLRYWITEFGFSCSKSNKYDFQNIDPKCMELIDIAKTAVKYNVMNLSKGIERIFFYNAFFDTNGRQDFKNDSNIMWDSKEPRPIVSAYSVLTWLLDGSSFVSSSNNNSLQEYTFKNGNRTIKVVWSTSNSQEYVLSQAAQFISLDGSKTFSGKKYQLTDEPVYVIY